MTLAERLSSHTKACTSCSRTNLVSSSRAALLVRRRICVDHRIVALSDVRGGDVIVTEAASPPGDGHGLIREELVKTRYIAETLLPTRHGAFRLRGYKHSLDGGVTFTEPTAIICGNVENQSDVPVRVHDACFTSEVLGSLKCDCAEQLALALEYIQTSGCGMVIYLQQEGRGIGLANKIAAYALQEQGLDTVDANRALGLPDDCREYTSVRNILRDLSVKSIQVMTNNPRKLDVLTQLGVDITGRIPCQVQAGEFNKGYLTAKRDRMDHLLDGSWCYWNHDGEPTQPSATLYSDGGMGLPPGIEAAKGTGNMNPALATHTVQLDEDEDNSSSSRSSKANSSSSAGHQLKLPKNGSTGFTLPSVNSTGSGSGRR